MTRSFTNTWAFADLEKWCQTLLHGGARRHGKLKPADAAVMRERCETIEASLISLKSDLGDIRAWTKLLKATCIVTALLQFQTEGLLALERDRKGLKVRTKRTENAERSKENALPEDWEKMVGEWGGQLKVAKKMKAKDPGLPGVDTLRLWVAARQKRLPN